MKRPLHPYERAVITDNLRPDPGFKLDQAVGATYSVDLEALLIVPMAFAMFDPETAGRTEGDPTALLAATETYAERVALYCDAAEIRSSAEEARLFVLLEDVLRPVSAPNGGRFHPKVWVLRFKSDLGKLRHRILVMTRNLTFDRSWDLIIRLDESTEKGAGRIGGEIARFLEGLDALSPSKQARDIASSIRRRRFKSPEPFGSVKLHSIGLAGPDRDPLAGQDGRKVLVMSPFLGAGQLEKLAAITPRAKQRQLISLPSEMERLGGRSLEDFGNLWRLHDEADPFSTDEDGAGASRGSGLHAKAYVIDRNDGRKTTWFVGSPNATSAAFEKNVEMLVELEGSTGRLGVNRILEEAGEEAVSFRSLLREFSPSQEGPEEKDPVKADEERLERIAREIAEAGVSLKVSPTGKRWRIDLDLPGTPSELKEGDRLWARLATAGGRGSSATRQSRVDLKGRPSGRLSASRASAITALVEFRISSGRRPKAPDRTFIVLGNLSGAPEDRREQLLVDLIEDEEKFRRLVFLLLASSDPEADVAAEARRLITAAGGGGDGLSQELGIPLFESLVRSYARDPERLKAVASVIDRFRASEEGRERLPEGFEEMWGAFSAGADR